MYTTWLNKIDSENTKKKKKKSKRLGDAWTAEIFLSFVPAQELESNTFSGLKNRIST